MPDPEIAQIPDYFQLVPFDADIVTRAASEKDLDFEDSVQLHSAAISNCDYFLTKDQQLLSRRYFGKTQILHPQDLTEHS
jgi:predicted nucleic acid-binding protein